MSECHGELCTHVSPLTVYKKLRHTRTYLHSSPHYQALLYTCTLPVHTLYTHQWTVSLGLGFTFVKIKLMQRASKLITPPTPLPLLVSSGARTSLYGHCTLHVHQPHQFPLRPTIDLFVFPFKRMEAIWRIYMDEHNTSRVCKYLLRKLYILHIICTAYGGKI